MRDLVVARSDRVVGVADFGPADGTPVLWCHGGPGSRLEPLWLSASAAELGLRLIGVDRPGYGRSTPMPGRTITDVVDDLVVVADHLGLDDFVAVGVSTGGAYALAAASMLPNRCIGCIACCAVTDMRWQPARETMSLPHTHTVWNAPDRDTAIAAAVEAHGVHGAKLLGGGMSAALPPSDAALFADPAWMSAAMKGFADMFSFGLEGYADDRIADDKGWRDFDVTRIRCPVIVLHGECDRMTVPLHAQHTAELVPGAELVIVDDLGHFSIEARIPEQVNRLLDQVRRSPTDHT